ncbi:MAG TPA: hypothetical protein VNA18_03905 [Nitrososphaeraceae archaeon]|nr:hypothetical protein [Nitrososphaeraceae archaeon]
MNEVEFLNRLMMLNPALWFSGPVEKSGHLNASLIRKGVVNVVKPEIQK